MKLVKLNKDNIFIRGYYFSCGYVELNGSIVVKKQVMYKGEDGIKSLLISIRKLNGNFYDICVFNEKGHIKNLDNQIFTSLSSVHNFLMNVNFRGFLNIRDEPFMVALDDEIKIFPSKKDYTLRQFYKKINKSVKLI